MDIPKSDMIIPDNQQVEEKQVATPSTILWSENVNLIFKALAEAQAEMDGAFKDGKNPHFKSRYATLQSVLHAVLPPLNKHGISLSQHPSLDGGLVSVTTLLTHPSGQWMSSTCSLPLGGRKDGHALKSATTYLRRTACVSICGLPEEDDDNMVSGAPPRGAPARQSGTQGGAQGRAQGRAQGAAQGGSLSLPPVPSSPAILSRQEVADELLKLQLSIGEVTEWCEKNGHPSPADMAPERMTKLIAWLGRGGSDQVRGWLKEQKDG